MSFLFINRNRMALLALNIVFLFVGSSVALAESKNLGDSTGDTRGISSSSRKVTSVAQAREINQILIRPKAGVVARELAGLHKRAGGNPVSSIFKLRAIRVNLESTDMNKALYVYRSSNLIEYAEPNYMRKATAFNPNDPYYPSQWGLKKIFMGEAWEKVGSNLSPVNVAVLDTGLDIDHEDLKGSLAQDSRNPGRILGKHFYTDASGKQVSDDDFRDSSGHGTHICGTIAGGMNNAIGIAGIASAAKVIPVKVLDDEGYGDDANIAEGLIWAVDNGARVVNMSLAGPSQSNTLADAVKYAHSKGAVVVAATGNDGVSEISYPAAYDGVIGVGATDNTDAWMHRSNFGSYVDVVAPGVSIWSTYLPSKSRTGIPYEDKSGTSMSASFVSGLAALILSANPNLTNNQVEGILFVTADDLGPAGWDRYYGYGRINAERALSLSPDRISPNVTITSPVSGSKISSTTVTVTATASDLDSGIAFVVLYLNGTRVGMDGSQPYEFGINAAEFQGTNFVRVVAYDRNGNSSYAETTCYKQTFNDVAPSFWAFDDIETLFIRKVVSGYPDGAFRPSYHVGRAEFVKMLIESMGLPKKSYYSGYFKDVPGGKYWAWPYVEAARDAGLVTGYDNKFLPENKITRTEMVVILIRTGAFDINYSGKPFTDVPTSYWAYPYIMSAKNAGIVKGYPGNYFKPGQAMSRAEAARIIKNSYY